MRQLIYTEDANANLVEIALYIAKQSASRKVAFNFTNRLREKCRHIAALPSTLGRARPELRVDIRSFPYQGYVIFFRYGVETFEIINILHGSRDIESYFGVD